MPCFARAMIRLGMRLPQRINEEKLEDLLMKALKVPVRRHELLRNKINELLAEDPEKLKKMLKEAIALAGKEAPPDRLKEAREKAKKVFAVAES